MSFLFSAGKPEKGPEKGGGGGLETFYLQEKIYTKLRERDVIKRFIYCAS